MTLANLYADAEPPVTGERFDVLLEHRNLTVERIVSSGKLIAHTYEQTQDEWVVLLRGEAKLEIAGRAVRLTAGDHLFLPAGTAHTVESASDGALWLAIHLHAA